MDLLSSLARVQVKCIIIVACSCTPGSTRLSLLRSKQSRMTWLGVRLHVFSSPQVDTRAMRSKSLITELETVFDERQEQLVEGGAPILGPHLLYSFPTEGDVFNDAVGLVMYYTKRASSLQHSDALKIRSLLTITLADFFFYPR